MHFSSAVNRISGERAEVWEIHYDARLCRECGEDLIILSVGEESSETTQASIQEAAVAPIRNGRHDYTSVIGEDRLREAIARRHTERNGSACQQIQCSSLFGAQNVLFAVSLCLLEKGDEVFLP